VRIAEGAVGNPVERSVEAGQAEHTGYVRLRLRDHKDRQRQLRFGQRWTGPLKNSRSTAQCSRVLISPSLPLSVFPKTH